MSMIRYSEEVKSQIRTSFFRVGLLIVFPLYLLCHAYDWLFAPGNIPLFFLLRFSTVPAAAFVAFAFWKKWPGPWHLAAVWGVSGFVILQLAVMACLAPSPEPYLAGIHIMSGIFLLLFPLPWKQALVSMFIYYMPYFFSIGFLKLDAFLEWPLMLQAFLLMIVFFGTSLSFERFRHKAFRQHKDLFFLATTDPVSGLKQRRYFFHRFIQELSLQFRKREELALSLAMIDIDSFKSVNDHYGHQTGDRILRHIGSLIQRNARIYDLACRFGGEEFVILFPATHVSEAAMICERLRKTIEANPMKSGNREIKVTVSVGISGVEPPVPEGVRERQFRSQEEQKIFLVQSMARVIQSADQALYEVKNGGKNHVKLGPVPDFLSRLSSEEAGTVKSYMVHFEQADVFDAAEIIDGEMPSPQMHYSPDFFFKRCMEGLYRNFRNPSWEETLALIRISGVDAEAIQRELSGIFRLSDVMTVLEPGLIGVLFAGMPAKVLADVRERVISRVASREGFEKARIRIAAAALQFEGPKFEGQEMAHSDFSKEAEKVLSFLRNHRFKEGEDIFIRPSSVRVLRAG